MSSGKHLVERGERVAVVHTTTIPLTLRFLTGQLSFLKEQGYEIHVISSGGEMLTSFATSEGVQAHVVNMTREISPIADLRSLLQMWRNLRRIRPKIVHAHTPKAGLIGTLAARFARVPVRIYHLHGLPMVTAQGYRRLLLRWSNKICCATASQVLSVSQSLQEVAIAENLVKRERIKVLHQGSINGVDAMRRFNPDGFESNFRKQIRRKYGIPAESLVVGFAGRLVPDKGIVQLVRAWLKLRDEFEQSHLLLVGPFESHQPLPDSIITILREDERIHVTGYVEEMPGSYAAMDVLVLPSFREGLPVSPIEASAMRIPVVATRIPGCINAVKDGETGLLVPPGDWEALAAKIRSYLCDPELRESHGRNGRDWVVRDFRPESLWSAIDLEYRRLLESQSSPMGVGV